LGYERAWGWLEETNRRGLNSWKNSQEVLITAIHSAHTHTRTQTLQLAANNDFLSERAGGTCWLQLLTKTDKKEKSEKLEKECQRKLENMGICLLVSSLTNQIGVMG
jgi:hypothetical protein